MTEDEANKPAKHRRLFYALLGALALSMTITFVYKAVSGGEADEIHWQCIPNENRSLTCVFDVSRGPGSICFDIVLDCADGQHQHNVCSGLVTTGVNLLVEPSDFEPPLPPDAACKRPRYLNQQPDTAPVGPSDLPQEENH